ncbi:MAG: hypothetical protein AAF220_11740 [Pseudomonadota bacterium]
MKTLHTARMVLRPYSEEDEGTIRALLRDEAVTRLLFAGGPITGDAYDRFIAATSPRTRTNRTVWGSLS